MQATRGPRRERRGGRERGGREPGRPAGRSARVPPRRLSVSAQVSFRARGSAGPVRPPPLVRPPSQPISLAPPPSPRQTASGPHTADAFAAHTGRPFRPAPSGPLRTARPAHSGRAGPRTRARMGAARRAAGGTVPRRGPPARRSAGWDSDHDAPGTRMRPRGLGCALVTVAALVAGVRIRVAACLPGLGLGWTLGRVHAPGPAPPGLGSDQDPDPHRSLAAPRLRVEFPS